MKWPERIEVGPVRRFHLLLIVLALLVWWWIWRMDANQLSHTTDVAAVLGPVLGPLAVLLGFYVALRRVDEATRTAEAATRAAEAATRTAQAAEDGLITERFTKAIGQLGDENLAVRLGGIFALEKIAEDAPKRYHWTVMEVLCAHVRLTGKTDETTGETDAPRCRPDLQAILDVLGRRRNREHEQVTGLDLIGANLRGAKLSRNRNLSGANLSTANLTKAFLHGELCGARLVEATLNEATLNGGNLREATLWGANLTGARLIAADLTGATLTGADFSGADLTGATLTGTDFRRTIGDLKTTLPPEIERPAHWTLPKDEQRTRVGVPELARVLEEPEVRSTSEAVQLEWVPKPQSAE